MKGVKPAHNYKVFSYFQHYGNLTPGQFQLIRMTILSFFQDMHIRVREICYIYSYFVTELLKSDK